MAAEPSNDDIQSFAVICNTTSEVAVRYLKEHSDLNAAISAFYEPANAVPDLQWSNSWDEGAFHTDKTAYGPVNKPPTSFTVHAQDSLNPAVFDGSMSRPPSRISNRATANENAGQPRHATFAEQEEDQFQKAMAMSMSQPLPDQEMGVTDDSGVRFGPATGSYYDQDKWAITAPRSNAQEILQNPDPIHRKRELGAPAFLKPSIAGHYIPPLITILHAIPMAREALLARDCLLPDYGQSDDWWDGVPIEAPRVVTIDQPNDEPRREEIVYEAQRLMAFLDQTERAYGNAEVLATLGGLQHHQLNEIEGKVIECWSKSLGRILPDSELGSIFRSCASIDGSLKHFHSLDLPLSGNVVDHSRTLYDALDEALWFGFKALDSADIFLTRVAEVLIVHAYRHGGQGLGLGIKVPAVWYADRYLETSLAEIKQIRRSRDAIEEDIRNIEKSQSKLSEFQSSRSTTGILDTTRLLKVAKSHFEHPWDAHLVNGSVQHDELVSLDSEPPKKAYSRIAEELQAVANRVQEKLTVLEQSKKLALQKMRELSNLYTKPSENADEPPHHKYTLRGVSTTANVTYVLVNPNGAEDLMDTSEADWQWWKIQFSLGDASPISYTKVREVEVLKAARDESNKALLVYASQKAVSYECQQLPSQLLNFVRADNLVFEEELRKATSPKQATPTKRIAVGSYDSLPVNNETNWGGYQSPEPEPKQFSMAPPPAYRRDKAPPPPPRSAVQPNSSRGGQSYDDTIPLSLQTEYETVDPKALAYTDVDLLGDLVDGHEMQERSGGMGVVPGGTGVGVGEYALGSYQPEIVMEDLEDEANDKLI